MNQEVHVMALSLHQEGLWKDPRNQGGLEMDLSLHQGGLWKNLRNSEGFETEGFQEQAN